MSSSQNGPTPARLRNQYVCRSPGHRMARHCSVVSPMTLFVSGALSRNYFVELVVYCVTCCTLKIARCCIHVLSLHCERLMRRLGIVYVSIASRRLRIRSSYVYLSIPPKSIVMVPLEMLTCNSQMCDTLALQLSPVAVP